MSDDLWEYVDTYPSHRWEARYFNWDKTLDDYLEELSRNPNITWEIVKNNPEPLGGEWDWSWLSANPNITWEIVRDNPDYPWEWGYLSWNPNITWEMVRDTPDKEWGWYFLSSNPNITWEIVRDNPDKPWDWRNLSHNPNITWEIIRDNPDKEWDLSWAQVRFEHRIRLIKNRRERKAAVMIQKVWFNYWWKPNQDGIARKAQKDWNEIKELI